MEWRLRLPIDVQRLPWATGEMHKNVLTWHPVPRRRLKPDIQCDSWGQLNILGGDRTGHCEENVHTNMFPVLSICSYRYRAVWIPRFIFEGLNEERCLQKKGGYTRRIVTRILDAAALIKKSEDQFRRIKGDRRTWVAKCTAVDGGIFEHLLWTLT